VSDKPGQVVKVRRN